MTRTTTPAPPDHLGRILALMAAVACPFLITVSYLVGAESLRVSTGAEGYARAALDQQMFGVYAAALGVFVLVGTLVCRGTVTRVLFAATAIAVSLFAMFVAFLAQMAP